MVRLDPPGLRGLEVNDLQSLKLEHPAMTDSFQVENKTA